MTHQPKLANDDAITCEQAATLFCEARDRDLLEGEQHALRVHIKCCDACVVASRQLEAVFDGLERLLGRR